MASGSATVPKPGLTSAFRRVVLGSTEKFGVLPAILLYSVLIVFSYIFLYPLLYMFITSIKSLHDLIDDSIVWIPTKLDTSSYVQAIKVMHFKDALLDTLQLTLVPAVCQIITAALTGYAIAQYRFRGRRIVIGVLILMFIVPRIATMMPTYLMYRDYSLIGTLGAIVFPAALGQGVNASIITLIFYQFYRQMPVSVVEAAKIDGCGHWRVFTRIALPSVTSAVIIAFLFSFVWYWNETTLVGIFVANSSFGSGSSMTTLLINLQNFEANYKAMYGAENANLMNEAIVMAGTMLCVLPLLVVYFVLQRFFVKSVDMIGIKE